MTIVTAILIIVLFIAVLAWWLESLAVKEAKKLLNKKTEELAASVIRRTDLEGQEQSLERENRLLKESCSGLCENVARLRNWYEPAPCLHFLPPLRNLVLGRWVRVTVAMKSDGMPVPIVGKIVELPNQKNNYRFVVCDLGNYLWFVHREDMEGAKKPPKKGKKNV